MKFSPSSCYFRPPDYKFSRRQFFLKQLKSCVLCDCAYLSDLEAHLLHMQMHCCESKHTAVVPRESYTWHG